MPAYPEDSRIPVTILTGFLGSGKTTLLKHILHQPHGEKIAVIENEFGEVAIDADILVESEDQQIVVLSNGCICCTVRGDLTRHLNDLARRQLCGQLDFSRVVIETTGLANPAPVVQTFFMDGSVRARYRLDGVVTLVDAKHANRQLDEHAEAQEQVAFADRLLVSKTDLISAEEYRSLRSRLARINARATIEPILHGAVGVDHVMSINGFGLSADLDLTPASLAADDHDHQHDVTHADGSCARCASLQAAHSDTIKAFVLRTEKPLDAQRFEWFLRTMLELHAEDMMRYKGIVNIFNAEQRFIFQGVHMTLAATPGAAWSDGERRESRLVFIGRNLPHEKFQYAFNRCTIN